MENEMIKLIDRLKNFKRFLNENITEIDKSINSIQNIDDSMSYKDFAKAVAYILFQEYGSHNYQPFLYVLNEELVKSVYSRKNEKNTTASEHNHNIELVKEKINLEEILKKHIIPIIHANNPDSTFNATIIAMKEACSQILALAAENSKIEINYAGTNTVSQIVRLSMEEILRDAARRQATYQIQFADYDLDTWTAPCLLTENRVEQLLKGGSVRKVRLELEM